MRARTTPTRWTSTRDARGVDARGTRFRRRDGATRETMMRMTTTRGAGRRRAMATKAAMGAGGGAMCVVAACATWYAGWYAMVRARETSEVRVTARETRTNARVLAKCAEILDKGYDAVRWLTNRHASTILSSLLRRNPDVRYQREILAMPEGGHASLDWPLSVDGDAEEADVVDAEGRGSADACEIERGGPPFVSEVFDQSVLVKRRLAAHHARLAADAPVLVLMSGIAGGSHDKYLKHFLKRARARGFRCVAFNCRGTSESPLTTPQFYSASYTGDIRHVVDTLGERYPDAPLFAIGWSLGANILTNFLGEEGSKAKLKGAAALCNPFDLNACDTALESGFFGKIYSLAMAKNMRKLFAPHENLFAGLPKYKPELVRAAKTVRDFDEAITRVTFGFPSVDAYYEYSGSKNKVGDVAIPLMTVQALDDPIAVADSIPRDVIKANPNVILLETETGGHLGWEAGPEAPFGAPWPDEVVMRFFEALLEEQEERAPTSAKEATEPVPAR